MNKKLIALAVAGLFAAPAVAFAQSTSSVTIYGVMKMSLDQASATGASGVGTNSPNRGRVSNHSSRIGFKGSEDLGDGISAMFQAEFGISSDVAGSSTTNAIPTALPATATAATQNALSGRNTAIGLTSKTMGTVLVGIWDTPYKTSTGNYDYFIDTVADYNAIISATPGNSYDLRGNNVVAYVSPDMSGFVGKVAYAFGENIPVSGAAPTAANPDSKVISLSGNYDSGPMSFGLGYEKHSNMSDLGVTAATSTSSTGLKLGGAYSFGDTKVALVWEKLKADSNAAAVGNISATDRKAWMINVAHKMGSGTIKAAYTKANQVSCSVVGGAACTSADLGASQVSLGYDHAMSKRTKIYGVYTAITNKNDAVKAGNAYTFASGGAGGITVAAGADPKAISFGMEHSF